MKSLELNTQMAVELGQSLETLDNLEYMMYSFYFNIVKKRLTGDAGTTPNEEIEKKPIMVGLPDGLGLK